MISMSNGPNGTLQLLTAFIRETTHVITLNLRIMDLRMDYSDLFTRNIDHYNDTNSMLKEYSMVME